MKMVSEVGSYIYRCYEYMASLSCPMSLLPSGNSSLMPSKL